MFKTVRGWRLLIFLAACVSMAGCQSVNKASSYLNNDRNVVVRNVTYAGEYAGALVGYPVALVLLPVTVPAGFWWGKPEYGPVGILYWMMSPAVGVSIFSGVLAGGLVNAPFAIAGKFTNQAPQAEIYKKEQNETGEINL